MGSVVWWGNVKGIGRVPVEGDGKCAVVGKRDRRKSKAEVKKMCDEERGVEKETDLSSLEH